MASPSYALFGVCLGIMLWSGTLLDTRQRCELARYDFRPGMPFIWTYEPLSSEARGFLIESEFNRSAGHVSFPYEYEYNVDELGSVGEGLSLVGGALDAFLTPPWTDINQVSVGKPVTIYSKKVEDVSQTARVGFRIPMTVTGTTIATLVGIFLCCAVGCIVKRWRWRALCSGCIGRFVVASAGWPAAVLKAMSSALISIIPPLISHRTIMLPTAPRAAFSKTSPVELSAYRLWWVVDQALKEHIGKPLLWYFASLVVAARTAAMHFVSACIASYLNGSKRCKDAVVRTTRAPLRARWFHPWRASPSSCAVIGNRPRAYASDEEELIAAGLIFPSSSVVCGNRPRAYALDEKDLIDQTFYLENALAIELGENTASGCVPPELDNRDEGCNKPASVVPPRSDFTSGSSRYVEGKMELSKLPGPAEVRATKPSGPRSILKTTKRGALSQKAHLRVRWCESLKDEDPVIRTKMAPLWARWFRPWRSSPSSCAIVGNRPRAYASDEQEMIAAGLVFPSSSVVRGNRPRAYALHEEDLVTPAFYVY